MILGYFKTKITIKILLIILFSAPLFGFHDIISNKLIIKKQKVCQSQNYKILVGKWITEDKDVIEFYQKNNLFEGKLVSTGDKGLALKHPEIIGSIIFKNLEPKNDEFINGKYYDIESKEYYSVSIKIISAKVIKLKFGSGLFSQTSEFKKTI
jgi:hypothetical protein